MSSRMPYETTIINEYLGKSKVLRARTERELQLNIWEQQRAWAEQEEKKREQEAAKAERERRKAHVEAQKQDAAEATERARAEIERCELVLQHGLAAKVGVDWEALKRQAVPTPFEFPETAPSPPTAEPEPRWAPPGREPSLDVVQRAIGVPAARPLLERLIPGVRRARESKVAEAQRRYEEQLSAHRERVREAREAYELALQTYGRRQQDAAARFRAERDGFERRHRKALEEYEVELGRSREEADRHNADVDKRRKRLAEGDAEASEWYLRLVLERSEYPPCVPGEYKVAYDEAAETAVVSRRLPMPQEIPAVREHRYVATRDEIDAIEMKPKERDELYESVIHQVALRMMHEVFAAPDACHVGAVVFNGWVEGVDPKTGNQFTSCILSCLASREQFAELSLELVAPKECLRGLKAVDAGPLAQLAPVRPILELDRGDSRIVDSRGVLAEVSESDNLATMDWEDFEHLVRDLFEREFAGEGAEVKVTQASRDRGVDAIAFDPDPIRGGKFVIQAKRYNDVVPVAAVRDLYGTMINEGAARGLLVTTSHYGRDAREFAKDKPITLIDGPNLVHMCQRHGYTVHIETTKGGGSP